MSPRPRVACVRVPGFPLWVARPAGVDDPTRIAQAIALVEDVGLRGVVRVVNRAARAAGIAPEHLGARARALCPELLCLPYDIAALRRAAVALGEVLEAASPIVEPDQASLGVFWVDAGGMRWLGGDRGLIGRLLEAAEGAGYPDLRVGVADGRVAARAACLWASRSAQRAHVVSPGGDADFLARQPISSLELPPELRAALIGLNLQRVAELRGLPPEALAARFGPAGRAALDQALGIDARRPVAPRRLARVDPVVRVLEPPVRICARLVFALQSLLDPLGVQLRRRGLYASRLTLRLLLDSSPLGSTQEIERAIEVPRPTDQAALLFALLRDVLERMVCARPLDAPVAELRIEVEATVPAHPEQVLLPARCARGTRDGALEIALARLQGRCGSEAVCVPMAVDDPRPERAGRWVPVGGVPVSAADFRGSLAAQVLEPVLEPVVIHRVLPRPEAIGLRAHAGRSARICWRGRWRRVLRWLGPERISGGWWGARWQREDWRLVLSSGAVLWVSRVPDTGQGAWLLRGWLD